PQLIALVLNRGRCSAITVSQLAAHTTSLNFKKMKIIKDRSYAKSRILTILVFCLAGACTGDFDELNTNPNSPTAVGAQYLLPSGLESAVDRYWGHRTRFERINIDAATLY